MIWMMYLDKKLPADGRGDGVAAGFQPPKGSSSSATRPLYPANDRYGAFKVGTHDDLVTALGLAVQLDREPRA